MTKEQKSWIDNANYESLLSKWRFSPSGDPFFQRDTGDYYAKVMEEKRDALSQEEQVQISKKIGW